MNDFIILQEYRDCRGMSELDAKVDYVKRCRSLKTYGVTFFLVKVQKKNIVVQCIEITVVYS